MSLDEALDGLIQRPETLKLLLREPGRSQSALARHLGLDASAINRLVNGARQMKAREIAEVRGYLESTKAPASEAHVRLKQAREAAGFDSAAQAADANGWAYSTYAGHENGSRGLSAEAASEYAAAFSVGPAWLLFGGAEAAKPAVTVRSGGRVTLDIKAEVSVGVAAQILALIEGDKL